MKDSKYASMRNYKNGSALRRKHERISRSVTQNRKKLREIAIGDKTVSQANKIYRESIRNVESIVRKRYIPNEDSLNSKRLIIDTSRIVRMFQGLFSTDIYKRKFSLLQLMKNDFKELHLIKDHKRGPLVLGHRMFLISKILKFSGVHGQKKLAMVKKVDEVNIFQDTVFHYYRLVKNPMRVIKSFSKLDMETVDISKNLNLLPDPMKNLIWVSKENFIEQRPVYKLGESKERGFQ